MKTGLVLTLLGAAVLLSLIEAKAATLREELREVLDELLVDKRVPVYTGAGVKQCGRGCLKVTFQQDYGDKCDRSPQCKYKVWVYKEGENYRAVSPKTTSWGDGTYEAKGLAGKANTKFYIKVCRVNGSGHVVEDKLNGMDLCQTVSGRIQ